MSHTEGGDLVGSNSEPARTHTKSAQPPHNNRPDNQAWLDEILASTVIENSAAGKIYKGKMDDQYRIFLQSRLNEDAKKAITTKIAEERLKAQLKEQALVAIWLRHSHDELAISENRKRLAALRRTDG